ncbi:MAG: efflux RND transporter periplasmic adaptor subunit [Clostridiaceae bacterium]|nr:efflux RND transporter periplasmic adaptor subunit [Clostridiaceae bacterium]
MKNKKIIYVIAAVVIVGIIAVAATKRGGTDVKTYTVGKGDMKEYIEAYGKVELDRKEKVYSKIAGIVESVKAEEGDTVGQGAELLTLDVEDLNMQIEKARAAHNSAKANLEELKKSIRPEEIKQTEAALKQAKASFEAAVTDYNYKKEQLDKVKALYQENAASQQSLKDAEYMVSASLSTMNVAQQQVNSAELNLELLRKGVSKDAIEAAEYSVEQARLQIEELLNNKGKSVLTAGMEGIVLARNAEKGSTVQPGILLYEIGDYSSAYIKVSILAGDAGKIKKGQKVVISGDILGDKEIIGEIYYIAPKAEAVVSSLGVEQQRIEMRIRYDTVSVSLKPGYSVDVDIITEERKSVMYVPVKTVFTFEDKDSVFVVRKGKAILQSVVTGIDNEDYIEIQEGLSEGDVVIVDPGSTLKPGASVN